jgi:RND family efflux transporter MFP subunit
MWEASQPIPDTGPLKVTVATPKLDKVALFTDLTGSVVAPESVQVRPRVNGFIKAVLFKEGQMVRGPVRGFGMELVPGEALFKIDPVTYDADVKQAESQIAVARAKLELAKADEERSKVGFDKSVISKQQYDSDVAKTKVADAELKAARSPLIKARQNLEWTTVRAPVSGKTDKAFLTPGNVATGGETQGTVLTTIVSIDPMYVYFDVDDQTVAFYQRLHNEGKLKRIDEGGSVEVRVKLLGDDEYNKLGPADYSRQGKLDFVGNQLNPTTGTLSVRGVFENTDKMLIPNRYVRGQVPLGEPYDGMLIPDAAVATDQGKKVVYAVGADNRVTARPVVLGPLSKGLRIVQSGLGKDERIIIRGIQRVQPGEPVEPEPGTIDYPAK